MVYRRRIDKMVERRRYPRYPVHYSITYKNLNGSFSKTRRAVVENASRTGLKLKLADSLKKDDVLQLNIYKSMNSKPIEACGKVIWQKDSPLVYGEKAAGIFLTKIGWTESGRLVSDAID